MDATTTFEKLRRQFSVRKTSANKSCNHVGGATYTSNGLRLKCCTGVGATCKLEEIDYLTSHLVQKCDQIDELKARLAQLEKKLDARADLPNGFPSAKVVNQTVNITVNNNYNIMAAKGVDILLLSWKTGGKSGVYEIAYNHLKYSAPSQERNRLLQLANSTDIYDRLTFQREVIVGLDQVLPQLPENMRDEADGLLTRLSDQTNQEAIKNNIEVIIE
jgi:uncharacterized coiled-coil protein SlyX